jgi:acyl-CoA synthetase (AMP-forming)/AMP-acid ligase II
MRGRMDATCPSPTGGCGTLQIGLPTHCARTESSRRSCVDLLPQSPEVAAIHIAIYKLGAVALPLAVLFGVDALSYRLENSGAKALITNAWGVERIAEIRNELPALKLVLSLDGRAMVRSDLPTNFLAPHPILRQSILLPTIRP